MAGNNREYVFLECTETGMRYYRTEKRVKGQDVKKIELKKYNSKLRKHTVHKERKK
ncbi:MAG: 50S ribosomal protein L33 [Planctomycetota bacterium]